MGGFPLEAQRQRGTRTLHLVIVSLQGCLGVEVAVCGPHWRCALVAINSALRAPYCVLTLGQLGFGGCLCVEVAVWGPHWRCLHFETFFALRAP